MIYFINKCFINALVSRISVYTRYVFIYLSLKQIKKPWCVIAPTGTIRPQFGAISHQSALYNQQLNTILHPLLFNVYIIIVLINKYYNNKLNIIQNNIQNINFLWKRWLKFIWVEKFMKFSTLKILDEP